VSADDADDSGQLHARTLKSFKNGIKTNDNRSEASCTTVMYARAPTRLNDDDRRSVSVTLLHAISVLAVVDPDNRDLG
jgi:hypothetical protein